MRGATATTLSESIHFDVIPPTTRPSVEKSRAYDRFFQELRRLEDDMGGPKPSWMACREFLIHDRRLHPN